MWLEPLEDLPCFTQPRPRATGLHSLKGPRTCRLPPLSGLQSAVHAINQQLCHFALAKPGTLPSKSHESGAQADDKWHKAPPPPPCHSLPNFVAYECGDMLTGATQARLVYFESAGFGWLRLSSAAQTPAVVARPKLAHACTCPAGAGGGGGSVRGKPPHLVSHTQIISRMHPKETARILGAPLGLHNASKCRASKTARHRGGGERPTTTGKPHRTWESNFTAQGANAPCGGKYKAHNLGCLEPHLGSLFV